MFSRKPGSPQVRTLVLSILCWSCGLALALWFKDTCLPLRKSRPWPLKGGVCIDSPVPYFCSPFDHADLYDGGWGWGRVGERAHCATYIRIQTLAGVGEIGLCVELRSPFPTRINMKGRVLSVARVRGRSRCQGHGFIFEAFYSRMSGRDPCQELGLTGIPCSKRQWKVPRVGLRELDFQSWLWNPFSVCLILSKLLPLSDLQFLHLNNG